MPPSLFGRWARMLEGAGEMGDLLVHRFQFAFTVVYHYLFPQLTMGLALLIVLMKARGLRPDGKRWNDAARFWIRIFGINFAVGVGTGISMEFQFGTNWARFSRYAGSVKDRRSCRSMRDSPVHRPRRANTVMVNQTPRS